MALLDRDWFKAPTTSKLLWLQNVVQCCWCWALSGLVASGLIEPGTDC